MGRSGGALIPTLSGTGGVGVAPHIGGRGYVRYHVISLAMLPLVLLAVYPNLFINLGGNYYLDPWIYTGFFLSFPDLLHRFGDTYYATRLPWLLPGFALHAILPALAANYALHLTFYYLLLLATYGLVAGGTNRSQALVTTVLVATNPLMLTSLSWDYVDGAGIVFLVITFCGLDRCARAAAGSPQRWLYSLLAGVGMACLVATNLALVTALPACAVFLFVRLESPRWQSASAILATAVAGALATLVVLGAVNRAFGGLWMFLQPSIHFGMRFRTVATNISKAPFPWSRAEWMALPLCAAIGAIVSLIARREASTFERAPQAAVLVLLATWMLLDLVTDTSFLRYPYYTSYAVALGLIALPLQRAPLAGTGDTRSVVAFELAILAALVLAHLVAGVHPPYPDVFLKWTPALLLAAVLGLQTLRTPKARWTVLVLGLLVSYAASYQYWQIPATKGRQDYAETADAHRYIARSVRDHTIRIWHPAPSSTSPPFRSIACTYLCNSVLVNEDLPRITGDQAHRLAPQTRLILLLNRASEGDDARASLRAFGLDYTVVTQARFGQADRTFLVIIADIVALPPRA